MASHRIGEVVVRLAGQCDGLGRLELLQARGGQREHLHVDPVGIHLRDPAVADVAQLLDESGIADDPGCPMEVLPRPLQEGRAGIMFFKRDRTHRHPRLRSGVRVGCIAGTRPGPSPGNGITGHRYPAAPAERRSDRPLAARWLECKRCGRRCREGGRGMTSAARAHLEPRVAVVRGWMIDGSAGEWSRTRRDYRRSALPGGPVVMPGGRVRGASRARGARSVCPVAGRRPRPGTSTRIRRGRYGHESSSGPSPSGGAISRSRRK